MTDKAISFTGRLCAVVALSALLQCAEDEVLQDAIDDPATSATADCGCTYTVPAGTHLVDGVALALRPGSVICLKAGTAYANLLFRNIRGTATSPVIIRNCGGTAVLNATGKPYAIKTELSQYFRITGGSGTTYGIRLTAGSHGVMLDKLSTDAEVDHIEIANPGFAGVMAKTDPNCDNTAVRGNFVMRNILLHHNYVHDTGGEGFYVGNTFFLTGMKTACGIKFPHIIEGVKIYNNVIRNSGWEAIQVGSIPQGAEVFNNRIENYGVKNVKYQNNGVQFGEGAPGKFYNNYIKGGKGIALFILSNGENAVYNNVIVNAGQDAIFCDERTATGTGFRFINNTIINPGTNGIRIYADLVAMNQVLNNVIVNPGSYSTYKYPRTGNDAYVYLLSKTVKARIANNYFTRDIASVKFTNAAAGDYSVKNGSPVIDKGFNIASYNIAVDYRQQPRLNGAAYDIGAYEY